MRRLVLIICFCFYLSAVTAQSIDWNKTSHWKMYKLKADKPLGYSVDTLINFHFAAINDDSIHYFLRTAAIWPLEKTSLWMGAYYASYEQEGKVYKADISQYGGFFYDEATKRYYQVTMKMKK